MSPNEFQLRDALHDGEGDVPDADRAIGGALRLRDERRRRITSIASAAVVVALVGVGGTLLARSGSGGSESGGAAGGAAGVPVQGAQMTHGGNPQPPAAADSPRFSAGQYKADAARVTASDVACPAQFPRLLLPGGGGTNQFGAGGPLFDAPVAAMKICVYGPASTLADSSVLTAPAATETAAKLEAGSLSLKYACPTEPGDEGSLAVYGVTAARQQLPVVTVDLGCPFRATNGTALRFLSSTVLAALRPVYSPSPNTGSPIK